MRNHVQVAVIGGGVVGASVLYHLTKAGWQDVLLIERAELTSGSTWHAAGGMHTVNGDPNVAKLQQYTIELYKEIEAISGVSCGVHITGGLMLAGTPELDVHRVGELTAALRALGAEGPFFLGDPPARATGLAPRRYTDSGMRWVTPSVAGPGDDAGPDAFTSAPPDEAAADLASFLTWWRADLVISYESDGGYGHPDHVHMHHVARRAAERVPLPFAEVVSIPRDGTAPPQHGVEWFDLTDRYDQLLPALLAHASQFTVTGRDAVHSGGQREPLQLRTGVRLKA